MNLNTKFAEHAEYLTTLQMDKSIRTLEVYTSAINRFFDYFKIDSLDKMKEITPAQCRVYQGVLKEAGLSNSSINTNTRPLKAFYYFFLNNEYVTSNPWCKVKELKVPKKEPVYLSEKESDDMISACKNDQELLIISVMIMLGLRRSEITNLKRSNIIDHHIHIIGKGSKERVLPLSDDLYKLLQSYLLVRDSKWGDKYDNVFISQEGNPISGEAIRIKVQSIGRRAGIPAERLEKIHPHSLRHTFCTNMIENESNIRIVQGAMGHSSLETTIKYSHLRNTALDKAVLNQRSILK